MLVLKRRTSCRRLLQLFSLISLLFSFWFCGQIGFTEEDYKSKPYFRLPKVLNNSFPLQNSLFVSEYVSIYPNGSEKYHKTINIITLKVKVWTDDGDPVPNCEVVCHYNSNPIKSIEETEYADAVFYYEKKEVNLFYDPAKVNILYALESFSIYRDEEVAFKEGVGVYFQVSANYHQENDEIVIKARQEGRRFVHVPITYAEDSYFDKPVPFNKKDPVIPASIFVSNCVLEYTGRNELIKALIYELGVDSFGSCFNNRKTIEKGCIHEDKSCVIGQYKFYLAFENSVEESYVTEKYWNALKMGTVPIYLGAGNIDQFDPLYELNSDGSKPTNWIPQSFIRASDFKTAEQLAHYVKMVANNETMYNSFLRWKMLPPKEHFMNLVKNSRNHSACKICKVVAKLKGGAIQL